MNFSSSPSPPLLCFALLELDKASERAFAFADAERREKVKQRNWLAADSSIIFSKDGVACLSFLSTTTTSTNAGARKCRKKEGEEGEGEETEKRRKGADRCSLDERKKKKKFFVVRSFVCVETASREKKKNARHDERRRRRRLYLY